MEMAVSFTMRGENQLVRILRSAETWIKRVEMPVAVYTLAVLGIGVGVITRVYPMRPDGAALTAADIPVGLRPVAYVLFALLIWAAMRVCMRLIPHIFRCSQSWWAKLLWFFIVILALPVGPLVYYLVMFRGSKVAAD
jgi:hypothetical protein